MPHKDMKHLDGAIIGHIIKDCFKNDYFDPEEEYISDEDCDRYAVAVANGDGYYDASGKFKYYED